jgi:hypothetical protein
VKVAEAFFHSLKQNMTQICCSFKGVVLCVHENYKWQKVLVTMRYATIHKLKLYSKQKMNQQDSALFTASGRKSRNAFTKKLRAY